MSHKDESWQSPSTQKNVTQPPQRLPSNDQVSLPHQINASSRSAHSKLNRLILARLPLALPPHSTESSTLMIGLLHIIPIYTTFESLWASIIETSYVPITAGDCCVSDACNPRSPLLGEQSASLNQNTCTLSLGRASKSCARMPHLLKLLRLSGLLRAERIRADVRLMSGMSEQNIDEQIDEISKASIISEFIAHIKQCIETTPHVIVAYAWVLYMALFSGGRFIRRSLLAAGSDFWMRPMQRYSENNNWTQLLFTRRCHKSACDIQFLSFDGNEDGEDIKLEFKRRIAEVEILLTDNEKKEIVQESQHIFDYMIKIVSALDSVCGVTLNATSSKAEK